MFTIESVAIEVAATVHKPDSMRLRHAFRCLDSIKEVGVTIRILWGGQRPKPEEAAQAMSAPEHAREKAHYVDLQERAARHNHRHHSVRQNALPRPQATMYSQSLT